MRAVALSDKQIQQTVAESFVPLKVMMTYPPRMEAFPLDWPAMRRWQIAYKMTGGKGFTGCSVVSPDLKTEYGSTGSAMVWELFDSTAYDAKKFQAMLDQSIKFAAEERELRQSSTRRSRLELAKFNAKVRKANRSSVRLPPKGFTADQARELFRLTGDLPEKESASRQ